MYVPKAFAESDRETLHTVIRANSFGLLVGQAEGVPFATHLPFLLEGDTLVAHMARANPHWRAFAGGDEALAIFQGPHAYVSPSWYAEKAKNGKVVPTWNYVTVHAHGELEFFEEKERLLSLVTRLTEKHEGKRAQPWAVSDAPIDYIEAHLKGIVGFRLPIARIEGKWKMSQNRNREDRQGVVAGLGEASGPLEEAVAKIMAREL